MIEIEFANRQSQHSVDAPSLIAAARAVLVGEGIAAAVVSVAVVDDPTIHQLNRRYLAHDYPTDVLSFVLEDDPRLEGEVIVSADTAFRECHQYGWTGGEELLLYVVHGVLHLVGYDDKTDADRAKMRGGERHYLSQLGIQPPDERPANATGPQPRSSQPRSSQPHGSKPGDSQSEATP